MNAFPSFLSPVLLSLSMLACSGFEDFPPEIQHLSIHCERCPEAGIDTIELHDGTEIRKISLGYDGWAETEADGEEVYAERVWLSADGVPMDVYDWTDHGSGASVLFVEPVDWGPTPLLDTVLVGRIRDSSPTDLWWESGLSDEQPFGAWMSTKRFIRPDSSGRFEVSLPRIYTRNHPHRTTSILHTAIYRGAPYRSDSLPVVLLAPSWPPPVGAPTVPTSPLVEQRTDGTIIRTAVYRRPDSTWLFLRVHSRDAVRIREDSGRWDPATGRASFLMRAPGTVEHTDTSTFAPRPVLFDHPDGLRAFAEVESTLCGRLERVWWRDGEPRLESTLYVVWNLPPLRYFQ